MKLSLSSLALRNLKRKRFRSITIMLSVMLAVCLVFSATTVLESVKRSLDLGLSRLGADILVVPQGQDTKGRSVILAGEPAAFYMDDSVFGKVAAVPGVRKAAPQLYMQSMMLSCCGSPNALLVGYDPAHDFTLEPWMRLGGKVTVWKGTENDPPLMLGSRLRVLTNKEAVFYGKQFRVGSVLDPLGMGLVDFGIFMTMDAARDMVKLSQTRSKKPLAIRPDQISSVLVAVEAGADVRSVAKTIESSVSGVKAVSTRDMISSVRRDVEGSLFSVTAAGIACWIMTLFLMGVVFAMIVNERQRELGLLRAMGATGAHTLRLIVYEAAILTSAGGLAGVAAGSILIVSFKTMISKMLGKLVMLWPSPVYIGLIGLGCVLLAVVSGSVAAALPALRTYRKEPYDAIRQGSNGQ